MGQGCWLGRNRPAAVSPLGVSLFAGDPELPGQRLLDAAPSRRTVFPVPPEEGWRRRMQLHYGKRAQPVTVMPFIGFRRVSPGLLSLWAQALPPGGNGSLSALLCRGAERIGPRIVSQFGSAEEYARQGGWALACGWTAILYPAPPPIPSIPRASRSRLTPGLASGAGAMPPSVPPG